MFWGFNSKFSSSFNLAYPLNTNESKIFICNQRSSHEVWTRMFDHILHTRHAPPCQDLCVYYSCYPWQYSFLSLPAEYCHLAWKSFTPRTFSGTSVVLSCSQTCPIQDWGPLPTLHIHTEPREVLSEGGYSTSCKKKLCILYSYYMSYGEKRRVYYGLEGIWKQTETWFRNRQN